MVLPRHALSYGFIACCILAVGACAPLGRSAAVDEATERVTTDKTLAFGYRSIAERALEPLSVAAVAMEGFRGLGAIDPEVTVSRHDGRVVLAVGRHKPVDYPEPAEDDANAWAALTMTVVRDAGIVSDPDDDLLTMVLGTALTRVDAVSHYAGPAEARLRRAGREGIGGIGIAFDMGDGIPRVTEVIDDTPAKEAGLAIGDLIPRVEGEAVFGLDTVEMSRRLQGAVGSEVTITVRRPDGHEDTLSLHRRLILPVTVTTRLQDGIAEFKITGFNQRTARSLTGELAAARAKLGGSLRGVVLDLRGNSGGLIDQAVGVADLFMADGLIVATQGRHPLANQSHLARAGDIGEGLPLVVLIDGKSASASEIVTGALQDAGQAVVIGTNSYGKGTVQTVLRLPNDGEITLTWARFHTPSGYALNGLGVLPTICTADETAVAETLITSLVDASARAMVRLNLERWRAVRLDDVEQRQRLRLTCPAARQADLALDMDLAEKMLGNRTAYARALALSSRPSAAAARPASEPAQVPMPR